MLLRTRNLIRWSRRLCLTFIFLIVFAVCSPLSLGAQKTSAKPNIVLVLADDLGYGDLGCYGNKVVKTANLNRFAGEGLKLTSCYSAGANCSPSRAGLMTGRTPTRVGVHNWIPFMSPMHLRTQEITIATLLKQAGYTTCQVGKWHLNGMFNLPGQPQPSDHGFDHWFSTQNNALPNHGHPYNFVRNGIPVGRIKGYAAEIVADEAIRWLEKDRDKSKPFFMFVCFHEPHEPIATDPRFAKIYPFDNPSKVAHHGNITQMDHAFGRLMKALDRMNLRNDTIVIFTSDNGPAITNIHPHGSAGPLRAKKGHLYDGGIRVPGIIRWPGHITPGGTSDEPVSGVDMLPTLCAISTVAPPKNRVLDGVDITPLFTGQKVQRKHPLYWHFNAAQSAPKVALRDGDWMLLAHVDGPQKKGGADILADEQKAIHSANLTKFELYNLRRDIGQKNDLAAMEPQRLRQMVKAMQTIYTEVITESPTWPAWTWPRYESKRIEWPAYWTRRKKK